MRFPVIEWLLYAWLKRATHWEGRPRPAGDLDLSAIKRILAISCTALGDSLLSTPALRALRKTYPQAHITWVIHPDLLPLFEGFGEVDEFVPYDNKWAGFFSTARRLRGYDLAVILHGNEPQASPLAYLSGARHIFKLPNDSKWNFLLSNRVPVLRWADMGHGIDQRLAVIALAGAKGPFDRRMAVPRHAQGERLVAERLRALEWDGTPLIALQPGASTHSRRWPADRFVGLADALLQVAPEVRFVVTGSPRERNLCTGVANEINSLPHSGDQPLAWASAGELPLIALPSLLGKASVLVTGDTGPMHLAVAVGTPVVALFAVSDPARSGPAYDLDRHIVVRKWRTCDPCLSKRCPHARPMCMENISVNEVAAAVARILQKDRGR
jgi:ADP-heptose:LPS heptosyltransferase